jgi:hypothetical protein
MMSCGRVPKKPAAHFMGHVKQLRYLTPDEVFEVYAATHWTVLQLLYLKDQSYSRAMVGVKVLTAWVVCSIAVIAGSRVFGMA